MPGPEPEHRLAGTADPEEGDVAFRHPVRRAEPDDIPVERCGTVEIGYCEVRLKEAGRRDNRHCRYLARLSVGTGPLAALPDRMLGARLCRNGRVGL